MVYKGDHKLNVSLMIIFFILVSTILTASNIYFLEAKVFPGPDETSNYLFAKNFASENSFKIHDSLAGLDRHNMFHFRSGITFGESIVPLNFLGPIYFYGYFIKMFGDLTIFLNLFFLLVLVSYSLLIVKITRLQKEYFYPSAILVTPLTYYLSHTYMNILPAISFLVAGFYYVIKFLAEKKPINLLLGTFFLSISVLFRYEFVLYIGLTALIFAIVFFGKIMCLLREHKLSAIICISVAFATLLPVLIMNNQTYDSPFKTGQNLFHDLVSTDNKDSSLNFLGGFFEPYQLAFNTLKYIVLFNPLLFLLSFLGFFLLLREKKIFLAIALLSSCLLILQYQGTAEVWGSNSLDGSDSNLESSLDHSIIRYWLIVYLLMGFSSIYFFKNSNLNKRVISLIILAVITYGVLEVTNLDESNIFVQKKISSERFKDFKEFLTNTPDDSIIFASRNDKYIVPLRKTATWWNGEEQYNATRVAESIHILYESGHKNLYVYKELEVDIGKLNDLTNEDGYDLLPTSNSFFFKIIKKNETDI